MNGTKSSNGSVNGAALAFIPVNVPKAYLPILKERHPESCFMYNQVVFSDKFKDELKFYTLSSEINSESWIVSIFVRKDNGRDISISAPNSIVKNKKPIASEIKESFSTGGLIDWDEAAVFIAMEKPVSAMIYDITVNIKGNVSHVHPCILYYMEKEDSLNLSIKESPGAEVCHLDQDKGVDFIMSTWKYAREGSHEVISKCIKSIASGGVYVDGKFASGVIIFGDGLLHCLYTSKDYRNRGFGKLTMQYCFKEFAKEGCIPCSTVEVKNPRSITFHEALGAKAASIVDYIDMQKLVVD